MDVIPLKYLIAVINSMKYWGKKYEYIKNGHKKR